MAERPISVAVASFREVALLDACLAAATREAAQCGGRVVVARAGTDVDLAQRRARWPNVTFVQAPVGVNVPELRGLAIMACGDGPVAVTEDHCVAEAGWLERLLGPSADVVGGAMGNAQTHRLIDWGAYFSEYGFFASARGGGTPLITGANVRYSETVVQQVGAWAASGEWEDVIHGRLLGTGRSFAFVAEARILQNQVYTLKAFMRDRFLHGYQYARKRLTEQGSAKRWIWAVGVVALPILLTVRVARAAAATAPGAFVRSLGFTVLFLSSWAVGEGAGYLKGSSEAAP